MPQRIFILLAWTGISVLALFLRLNDLSARPMHADEATGARILAQRLETGNYAFDPIHFHGPLLTATAEPVARLRGENNWQELSEKGLRLVTAIAGVLVVLSPLLFTRITGQAAALAAAVLLATSPLQVYYSRMFIHETILALTALVALPLVLKWLRSPKAAGAILAGILVGLMWSSKETFVITLFAWSVAAIPLLALEKLDFMKSKQAYLLSAALLAMTAFATAAVFYTDFLRHPAGIVDALRTYFVYETVGGHDKPFAYYFDLLLWPKSRPGGHWWEGAVALLAVAAIFLAIKAHKPGSGNRRTSLLTFLTVATAVQFVIYSLIAYKTPWLMVVPWAHACLIAGCLFMRFPSFPTAGKVAAAIALSASVGWQISQAVHATGRFETDPRNPYAYVPTVADADKLGIWLKQLEVERAPATLEPVAIVGTSYWPLPWFLRNFEEIGYWAEANPGLREMSVVIAMPPHFQRTGALLEDTHTALPRGLRQDTPVMVYIRNDHWEQWMRTPAE